jgi:16S rRNA (cytosine1402-N4)-methyltransferase
MSHIPVLYHEVLQAIKPHKEGLYIDGTVGAGAHAWGLLDASSPSGRLIGLDLDPTALEIAQDKLASFGDRATLKRASYTTLKEQVEAAGWSEVDGILLDLGVSSMQLDSPEKGFSFRVDAPLDMRFDPDGLVTASDLVNGLGEKELAEIIYTFGEERKSRQIARKIIRERPIGSTRHLAEVIRKAVKPTRGKIHPATRVFQALRIATNKELEALKQVLPQAAASLTCGGRLAVISFHSLEDRIVKHYFIRESQDCICPPESPICTCQHQKVLKILTKRPIQPSDDEVQRNIRSRSARLRVAEKI